MNDTTLTDSGEQPIVKHHAEILAEKANSEKHTIANRLLLLPTLGEEGRQLGL